MGETRIEPKILCFDIMLNYRLSQKLNLLGYGKFNHLTNTSNKIHKVQSIQIEK